MTKDEKEWADLEAIHEWLNDHEWKDSPEFDEFLKERGIDRSELTIHVCKMPEWA